jgi:hypothetical protein
MVDSGGNENVPPVPGTVSLGPVSLGRVSGAPVVPGPVGDGARDVELAASSLLHAASAVNVAAIPQLDRRNTRRDIPNRRALVSATASVRLIASATTSERGNGAYSPFDSGWKASGRPGSSGERRVIGPIVGPPRPPASAALISTVQGCNVHYMPDPNDAPVTAWFTGRLPDAWTQAGAPTVTVDREEIHVILTTAAPELADDVDDASRTEAIEGRIAGFREDTREKRMAIAREAEHRFDRKVAWGLRIGDRTVLFTHLAVPVMTRLRQPERLVLDTLVGAGVARSRSDALAWCVRLVNKHSEAWLADLRGAIADVERIRADGPDQPSP